MKGNRRSSVLIIGCGGIGAVVAVILTRCGTGRFILVDFDGYSLSNMNRQGSCFTDTVDRSKLDVTSETLRRITIRPSGLPNRTTFPKLKKWNT
ncbi:MAG: hypothetical protein AVO39_01620 [delta proteobacterium MLS_D]|jgi:tRNA A37 threonylcarbamoyladenosine dehydratase|nr:MAG: hypothetical protein AVO39_01620 [delta proteobacterium MLS_D]